MLGTGGAVKKALKYVKNDFALTYADAFLNYDYNKVYNFYKLKGTNGAIYVVL